MKHYQEQMPLYVARQLNVEETLELEKHLTGCPACKAELDFWCTLADEITASDTLVAAPVGLADRALMRIRDEAKSGFRGSFFHVFSLLRAQAFLVQREMWPASAAVMALGIIVALISEHVEAIYFIAPLVTAASLSVLFSPEYDPAYELTLATPTSPWKVLLARLSIVSCYNLLLVLVAAAAVLALVPPGLLGMLILGWLAPMAFLSALALLLSLWIGTSNAITFTYLLWIVQYMPYQSIGAWMISPAWTSAILAYQQFWHSPVILFSLSIVLVGMALWSAGRQTGRLAQEMV